MHKNIIKRGELIHVLHRFEKEVRRHFVGDVEAANDTVARASGFVFVVDDSRTHEFAKRPQRRTKLIALGDGELLINVLPPSVKLDDVRYETKDHRLYVTDGKEWQMDLKKFGWD